MDIVKWFTDLNTNVQSSIITAIASLLLILFGVVTKIITDRILLNIKLKREYLFNQRIKIKEEIAKVKVPLLNVAEDLNYRLWNLCINIDKGWHNINVKYWKDKNYYFHSFVYRFIVFLKYILCTDEIVKSFDSTVAARKDIIYLKYIKTFKNLFCDVKLIEEFNYDTSRATNHFFKDHLRKYVSYVEDVEYEVIDFNKFQKKIKKDFIDIKDPMNYISKIKNDINNINYNVIKGFHLILMAFLNKYGHDYQKTGFRKSVKLILSKYVKIKNKYGFIDFLKRSKIYRELWLKMLLLKSA